jgi:signal transduction histidine kinase
VTQLKDDDQPHVEGRAATSCEAAKEPLPEPKLWEGEDRFRLLLGELQVGVLLQSPTAEILSNNPRALELLGLSEDPLLGRTSFHPDWNVIHEDGTPYPGPTHPAPLAIATRQPVRDAVLGVYRPANQDRVWLLVNALPELALDGSVRMVLCTITDITERKLEEERRRRIEAQLHQFLKMESLGLLAGGVAHDINNVLGSILAVATVHRRKSEEGSALRQGMEKITKACLRGGSLAKSLQGFASKDPCEETLLNLNDLILDEVRRLERTIPPNICIREELSDSLWRLQGDRAALGQAITCLCANAIQAMLEGGTLWLRTRNDGPHAVLLEVEDSGVGMAQEAVHQAMAPFYTTKQSTTSSGLGLAIVYGTVRSHRGTIDLQSEPGRGTLVRLRFPAPIASLTEVPFPQASGGAGAAAGKRILLVDDDPLILESTPGRIEGLGHTTTTAASGEEALALIDQGFRPDLVILDVHMPGIGGLETLVQLRKRDATLPILLTTGYSSEPLQEMVKEHPGVHLMAKPYDAEALRRHL